MKKQIKNEQNVKDWIDKGKTPSSEHKGKLKYFHQKNTIIYMNKTWNSFWLRGRLLKFVKSKENLLKEKWNDTITIFGNVLIIMC